jgi:hypothetical protein
VTPSRFPMAGPSGALLSALSGGFDASIRYCPRGCATSDPIRRLNDGL